MQEHACDHTHFQDLRCASNGAEALNLMRERRPDLILMDMMVDCLKAGAVDFVVKPPDREILLKKVERILSG